MKNKGFNLPLLFSFILVLILLSSQFVPAYAYRWTPPPAATTIVFSSLAPLKLGDPLAFYAQLRDSKGNPIPDAALDFSIDFIYYGQARTDANGIASYATGKKLYAGDHPVSVDYAGSKSYLPASKTRKLTVDPTVITVQTYPPLAGVTYNMDNRDFVSGPDGVAQIKISRIGKYTLSVKTDNFSSPDMHIEFGRWETESYQPFRDVDVPTTDPIQAGMNVFYKAGQVFVDLDGKPVDVQRITKVTIKSIQGDVFSFPNGDPQWLPASRVARRLNGLEVTQLQYGVMNVTVEGSNVVNQAQQRFFVNPNDTWKVSLLLYSMRITAKDGLFGSPVGKSVRLEFPNGEVRTYPLDANGSTEIRSLARGIYHVQVNGVKGMISPTPVALSRNQEVTLQVITNKDMEVVGAAGLVVVIGLLLIGRPWLLLPWMRRRRKIKIQQQQQEEELAAQSEGYVSIHNN